MAEQIMSEVKVACTTKGLFRRRHLISRVNDVKYGVGPTLTQIGSGNLVRSGLDPEVSHVFNWVIS